MNGSVFLSAGCNTLAPEYDILFSATDHPDRFKALPLTTLGRDALRSVFGALACTYKNGTQPFGRSDIPRLCAALYDHKTLCGGLDVHTVLTP